MRVPALVALILAMVAVPAQAARTRDVLPLYNGVRHANELPFVNVVNPAMETGCANHDNYMALNHVLVHGEDPSKPGYTPQGNYQDGAEGGDVLANMPGWSATWDPWESAPIHLYALYNPGVFQVGYADGEGFACLRMRGPDNTQPPVIFENGDGTVTQPPPPPPTFYAWTGETGRKNVPPSEHAAEYPYVPQQLVGIPASRTTGPNLLVFSSDNQGVPLSATLTGPGGTVSTALVNVHTKNSVGDGGWFGGGGVLIPIKPLRPSSTYTATVQWDDNGPYTQTFTFTTGRALKPDRMMVLVHENRAGLTRVTVTPPAARPTLALTGPGNRTLTPRLSHGATPWLNLRHGMWNACAAGGGGSTGFSPATACVQLLSAKPALGAQ